MLFWNGTGGRCISNWKNIRDPSKAFTSVLHGNDMHMIGVEPKFSVMSCAVIMFNLRDAVSSDINGSVYYTECLAFRVFFKRLFFGMKTRNEGCCRILSCICSWFLHRNFTCSLALLYPCLYIFWEVPYHFQSTFYDAHFPGCVLSSPDWLIHPRESLSNGIIVSEIFLLIPSISEIVSV